jgi:hypothetical protein
MFRRTLGYAAAGGADPGECWATATRITDGQLASWYRAWYETAQQVHRSATAGAARRQHGSARAAYLRAATYYRTAAAFLPTTPPVPLPHCASVLSQECFVRAGGQTAPAFAPVALPYGDRMLPGYFFPAGSPRGARPTLILQPGLLDTAEDLYFALGVSAARRGYHCLAFEGPGQGRVLREHQLPLRPDWEVVIAAVVDYLGTRPEVDTQHLGLVGFGFGGTLAARAAAFEPRLAACVIDGAGFSAVTPAEESGGVLPLASRGTVPHRWADLRHYLRLQRSPAARQRRLTILRQFQATTPQELRRQVQAYSLDGLIYQIQCPMLVYDHAAPTPPGTPAQQLYQALTGPKAYRSLARPGAGAGAADQAAVSLRASQSILDWLDERFAAPP